MASPELVETLVCTDRQRFCQARDAIVGMGRLAVPDLIEAVQQSSSDRDRWRYLLTLAEIADPEAVPVMVSCLRSPSSAIRALAAQFLAQIGDRRAVQPMIEMVQDEDPAHSPLWAVHALGQLGDTRAVQPLIEFLHCAQTGSERYMAIEALGLLGDPIAIEHIRLYAADSDHHVRDRVRTALERLSAQLV